MVSITVSPRTALVDVPLKIVVRSLNVSQKVTLVSKLISELDKEYNCFAHYVADCLGTVDLEKDASVGGFYSGVEPMGLIWAMRISRKCRRKFTRLEKLNVLTPYIVQFSVFGGHLSGVESSDVAEAIATAKVERWYKGPGVRRIPVDTDDTKGTLFLPTGDGPFPGLLDLFGSKRGVTEFRSALLASHGYASLTIEYYGKDYRDISIERFERALKFLSSRKDVASEGGIGVIGVSLGGTIALFLAAYTGGIGCAVNINGPLVTNVGITMRKRRWDPVPIYFLKTEIIDNAAYFRDTFPSALASYRKGKWQAIEFYESKVPILFLTSSDDAVVRWEEDLPFIAELMRKSGSTNYQVIENPGAGHLLEPPYSPHCWASYFTKDLPEIWGGNAKDHADAQERCWRGLLEFLHSNMVENQLSNCTRSKL